MITAAEHALVEHVIAAPDDDAPRLVLADWLSQQGEPRGELIVAACTLQKTDLPVGTRRALERRYEALLHAHAPRWLDELGLKPSEGHFVRGMVERVEVHGERLLTTIDSLFASTPVRSLRVLDASQKVWRVLRRSPHLARLRSLAFEHLEAGLAAQVNELESLSSLKALQVARSEMNDDEVTALASSQRFGALEVLRLDRNRLGLRGAVALAHTATLPALKRLYLSTNAIADDGVKALSRSTLRRDLSALDVSQNQLSTAAAQEIAATPALTKLEHLNLGFNPIGDLGVIELCRSMWLGNLTRLNLERTRFNAFGARALVTAVNMPKLQMLEVAFNYLPPDDEARLKSHFLQRVHF